MLPLDDVAWLLAMDDDDSDDDAEEALLGHTARVRAALDDGSLADLTVGSFYAWRGEPVLVAAEDVGLYVLPVPEGLPGRDGVARFREHLATLLDTGVTPEVLDECATGLGSMLASAWGEMLAMEAVADWVADDLDGEDPLHPDVRWRLGAVRARLLAAAERLTVPVVFPAAPDRELVASIKQTIRTAGG